MNKKTKKIRLIRILRALSQLLFFLLLPGLYVGVFASVKQVYRSLIQHTFSVSGLLPQLVGIVAIIPVTLLLGRFFCGWMCAFGSMGDFLSAISHRLFKKRRFRMPEKADCVLKGTKYLLLLFLIVLIWSFGVDAFKSANPWDAFALLLTPGSMPDIGYVAQNLMPALLLLIAIIIASLFVDRFFCRYLCPLGAIFAIVSKLRLTGIKKPSANCGKCRICTGACPMGIPLYQKDQWRSGACIDCFACREACPRGNVAVTVSGGDVRPALAGTMVVAVMTGVYYAGSFASDILISGVTGSTAAAAEEAAPAQQSPVVSSETADETTGTSGSAASSGETSGTSETSSSIYKNGTYRGTGIGYRRATTTLSVTIQNDRITDITLISNGDTPTFFQQSFSTVVAEILSGQSANVHAVSGATFSSNGIMEAVADALSQARN